MNHYDLTNEILNNIALIERLYGQLEILPLPQKLQLNLERNNLIQSSYVSNSIEGNPLNLAEVTNLLLDDRIPSNRSEKEIKNYFEILKSLNQNLDKQLTVSKILDIHRQLISNIDKSIAGSFRNQRVVIGKYVLKNNKIVAQIKHDPPYHRQTQINKAITKLVNWVNTTSDLAIIKIALFHHYYVYIHPFIDGNGRTARLLTALLFLQHNYQINKYFVLDDYYDLNRQGYSNALHSADGGDATAWLIYFTNGIKYSLQSALAKAKNALTTVNFNHRPTAREKEILALFTSQQTEITTSDVVKKLKVSRQQAQNLLTGLINKGLVKKYGSTKNSYYKLK